MSSFGPDVRRIEEALGWVAAHVSLDASRLAIGGFSDGASYALSLGLSNGDLFGDIWAFSPGFAAPGTNVGRPRVFIAHGRHDDVLPIDRCGRPLARRLSQAGYEVDYREFDGGHVVPHEITEAAAARFLGQPGTA